MGIERDRRRDGGRIRTRARARARMLALGLLWGPAGLAAGCGAKQPELVVDPALANKPFPTVQSVGGTAPARPAAFPSVGERRGP